MDLTTVTGAVNDIVTSSAVIVGGIWAYFKFIRGRTFARRAELDVSPSIATADGNDYLAVTINLKNTGLSKLPLNSNMKIMRIFRMINDSDSAAGLVEWERISTMRILDQHDWVESQETVADTLIYRVGDSHGAAGDQIYQIEAIVGAPRRLISGE